MARGEEGVAGTATPAAEGRSPGGEPQAALLVAARRGDPDAFMSLMAHERPRLESLAYRLLDDGAEVADVLQEVYLSAYRALPKYRGDSRLATWLYRITYNACLAQRARRLEVAETPPEAEPAHPDHAGAVARRLDLAAALGSCPSSSGRWCSWSTETASTIVPRPRRWRSRSARRARASPPRGRSCAGRFPRTPRGERHEAGLRQPRRRSAP